MDTPSPSSSPKAPLLSTKNRSSLSNGNSSSLSSIKPTPHSAANPPPLSKTSPETMSKKRKWRISSSTTSPSLSKPAKTSSPSIPKPNPYFLTTCSVETTLKTAIPEPSSSATSLYRPHKEPTIIFKPNPSSHSKIKIKTEPEPSTSLSRHRKEPTIIFKPNPSSRSKIKFKTKPVTTTKERERKRSKCSSSAMVCEICMDHKPYEETFSNPTCSHTHCNECITKHIASKLQENLTLIECPVPSCKQVIEIESCMPFLPKEVFERWSAVLSEATILGSNKYYCPFEDCSGLLEFVEGENINIKESECPYCNRLFCARCKVPWHSGFKCEEFEMKDDDDLFIKLAMEKKWTACPNCACVNFATDVDAPGNSNTHANRSDH
ncbi:hypothetical protein AMTR_s00129p00115880 [Amborella trichopoda]|uniref:RBR-type E3 ubiquitin transferase n=1 Tax=Amborella trichopoda TaxID=13333 RepID=W1NKS5_AMBTC|nr:hypothetical protein AMTR_s00129p00115880 [Amborella trichopoda]